MSKKIIAVMLCLATVFCMVAVPVGAESTVTIDNTKFTTDYPYIFVHGMGGWGPDNEFYSMSPYWGGGLGLNETDMIKILNEQGIEAYAPSVGPLSSA